MGLTSSGPWCDVGGEPVLLEPFQWFSVEGIAHKLLACEHHIEAVKVAGTDWRQLPSGPLRKAFAAVEKEARGDK